MNPQNKHTETRARPHRKRVGLWHVTSGFFVSASITVGLSADENWVLRWVAVAMFLATGVYIFLSYLVSPKFVFIGPKLVDASLKVRATVEIICRIVMLGLTAYLTPILVNMCIDFRDVIQRGSPVRTEATITYNEGGGLWTWAWKEVGLKTADRDDARYNLFFHPHYPQKGERYEIVLLPKSKCVSSLQARDAK